MSLENRLAQILSEILDMEAISFTADTPLLGAIPEFDSMAITRLIIELEGCLHVTIDDIDLTAEMFSTFGSLLAQLHSCHDVAA